MCASDPPVVLEAPGWQPADTLANDGVSLTGKSIPKELEHGCSLFNKESFNEYTKRGKYLDYIVWPDIFLHRNGPLLKKGVAQGTNVMVPHQADSEAHVCQSTSG